jgi:hypothetical protein
MHPEIPGSSAEILSTQPGQRFILTTCGSTNPEGIWLFESYVARATLNGENRL